ncbi:MAG: amino acid permease [Spiroplasma sp.]|nr:amino acid permease [Spiroplasma sp.]
MLKRKYGLLTTTMVAISATLGSSILISFGQVAFYAKFNPILMLLAWGLGGLLIIPSLLIFAETTVSYPENGTTYNWLKKANYKAFAFWFGWILVLIVSATAIASITIASSELIASLFNITNPWITKAIGISLMLVTALFHIFTKKLVIASQTVFTILKFVPIIFIIVIAIIYGSFNNFHNQDGDTLKQAYLTSYLLLPAIAMTMFAYSGIESVTYIAGEVKEPKKNIIWAKILATIIVVSVYLILALSFIIINVSNDRDWLSTTFWQEAFAKLKLPSGLILSFNIFLIIMFYGSLNAFFLYHSRMVHKLAQEKDLAPIFAKVKKDNDSPYLAIILLIVLASVYILWDQLYSIVTYFIIATTILQFISIIVACQLRYKRKDYQRLFNNVIFWILLFAVILADIVLLTGAIISVYLSAVNSNDWWILWKCFIVCGVLLAGYPIYYLRSYCQKLWFKHKLQKKSKDDKPSVGD